MIVTKPQKEGGSPKTIRLAASSFADMQGWIFALSKCAFGKEPVSEWVSGGGTGQPYLRCSPSNTLQPLLVARCLNPFVAPM